MTRDLSEMLDIVGTRWNRRNRGTWRSRWRRGDCFGTACLAM